MKNLKDMIEKAATLPLIEALQLIEDVAAVRNGCLRVAFYATHSGNWYSYTTIDRENVLADYVAELQRPTFSQANTACPDLVAKRIEQLHYTLAGYYGPDFSYTVMARGHLIGASNYENGHVKPVAQT